MHRVVIPALLLTFAASSHADAQSDSGRSEHVRQVRQLLATVRRDTRLRAFAAGRAWEGLLDTCDVTRFTLHEWSIKGRGYRERVPLAKVPYALVDTIWKPRAGAPRGIAVGILTGALAGAVTGLALGKRVCPVEGCSLFASTIAGTSLGIVAGGGVGGIVGFARRGWSIAYASP